MAGIQNVIHNCFFQGSVSRSFVQLYIPGGLAVNHVMLNVKSL